MINLLPYYGFTGLDAGESEAIILANENLPVHDKTDSLLQKKRQNDVFKISKWQELQENMEKLLKEI